MERTPCNYIFDKGAPTCMQSNFSNQSLNDLIVQINCSTTL